MSETYKTIRESRARQDHIIMPMDVNSDYTLFGGQLMQWIDVVAGVVARRHSGCQVCTAAVDHLDFIEPARIDDVVSVEGRIIYAGRTSMIVCVETLVEHPATGKKPIRTNLAYLTMVAMDKEGKPTTIPKLKAETEEDEADLRLGEERRAMRTSRSRG